MVFSSVAFLNIFLPLAIIIYFILAKVFKANTNTLNLLLIAYSVVFYYYGADEKSFVVLLLIWTWNYFVGYVINRRKSKTALVFSIAFNLGVLFRFKYPLLALSIFKTGFDGAFQGIFPLGLSFIIFHCISYCVEIYKKSKIDTYFSTKNLINYSLYIMFFPKLIQGPIVRFSDMSLQIDNHDSNWVQVSDGLFKFIIGFCKKTIIADPLGTIASQIFALNNMDTPTGWIGLVVFTLQIYMDFSGYSDMAIGISNIFGFKIQENFRYPYVSTSVSEFWKRWHISLGEWFKNYVYIPLGGNRRGNVYFNLLCVFFLTGIWHGNTPIYVFWGLGHGLFVMLEKTPVYRKISKYGGFKYLGWIYTMLVVSIGWLCFILPDLSSLNKYLKVMFGLGGDPNEVQLGWELFMTSRNITLIIIAVVISVLPALPQYRKYISRIENYFSVQFFRWVACITGLVLGYIFMISNGYSPFIYFQY